MDLATRHLRELLRRVAARLDSDEIALGAVTRELAVRAAQDAALPLVQLQRRAELDQTALDVLIALASPGLEFAGASTWHARFAAAAPSVEELVAVLRLGEDEAEIRDALGPDAPLVASGLVALAGGDAIPYGQRLVRVDERVVAFLRGDHRIDRRLREVATVRDRAPVAFDTIGAARIARALDVEGPIVIEGPARVGKTTAAVAAIASRGQRAIVAELERVLASEDPRAMLALLRREALLSGDRVVLRMVAWQDACPARLRQALVELVQAGAAVVVAREGDELCRLLRGPRRIEIAIPSPAAQDAIWRVALAGDGDAREVCARYPLPPGDIELAAAAARATAHLEGRGVQPADLRTAARARVAHRLGEIAELVTTELTWEDLVLRDDLAARVHELLEAVRLRDRILHEWGFGAKLPYGRSISALLSGAPGTGKTMVATLIAKELGLELFRVDLSKVVSKYIGETEKNLGRVFDEASRCRAVLLFDEADSLFAKRTEVKSSNDRFANLEVNFLLQRLEQHDGVVLLTTNAATAIDHAFLRRLRYRIEFAEPDDAERARLWQAMVPASAPLAADVDFEELGRRFRLSGGHIKNAVVRAAFVAMSEGKPAIDQGSLLRAATHEWTELGNLTSPAAEPERALRIPPAPAAPPVAPLSPVIEAALGATIVRGPAIGETIDDGYRRKERELCALFAVLSSAEARALHGRLSGAPPAGDAVATAFARMSADRRARLLAFLGDARRREARRSAGRSDAAA